MPKAEKSWIESSRVGNQEVIKNDRIWKLADVLLISGLQVWTQIENTVTLKTIKKKIVRLSNDN